MEHEDVVGAAPTGDAPTTSELSTILLSTKVQLVLEIWRYFTFCTCISRSAFTHEAHQLVKALSSIHTGFTETVVNIMLALRPLISLSTLAGVISDMVHTNATIQTNRTFTGVDLITLLGIFWQRENRNLTSLKMIHKEKENVIDVKHPGPSPEDLECQG